MCATSEASSLKALGEANALSSLARQGILTSEASSLTQCRS